MDALVEEDKENAGFLTPSVRRRGQGIDFQEFAQHTQATIHKEMSAIFRSKGLGSTGDSRRKQQLHHGNWVNEQRMIKHKLEDAHSRLEQAKLSEYDCQR